LQTIKYANKQRHKLYICNIPRTMTRSALLEAFCATVAGIMELDVTMQKDQGKPDENRGFCFLEMYNQPAAEVALKKLSQDVTFAGECAHWLSCWL
jgi:RNA recognition motif-containing protein